MLLQIFAMGRPCPIYGRMLFARFRFWKVLAHLPLGSLCVISDCRYSVVGKITSSY